MLCVQVLLDALDTAVLRHFDRLEGLISQLLKCLCRFRGEERASHHWIVQVIIRIEIHTRLRIVVIRLHYNWWELSRSRDLIPYSRCRIFSSSINYLGVLSAPPAPMPNTPDPPVLLWWIITRVTVKSYSEFFSGPRVVTAFVKLNVMFFNNGIVLVNFHQKRVLTTTGFAVICFQMYTF